MMNGKIDLRSDTVTIPTPAMRDAMATALVGDDVYGDDPTVNELERLAADLLGKECALFVPSGTMSNQLALFSHVQRGQEVLLPDRCHIVQHEAGASAILAGAQLRCLQTVHKGEMPLALLEESIRKDPNDIHQPKTALITYENADSDGCVRSLDYMKQVYALATRYQIPVHVDGARFFNAACTLSHDVKEMAQYADSVSICLSKGLCAPVGSVLVGNAAFIADARRKRKILGGGMRQAGILAAAGILALTEMTKRLAEDHANARYFMEQLSTVDGLNVLKDRTEINMVFFQPGSFKLPPSEIVAYLLKHNVISNGIENGTMRFVTHNYVDRADINTVVSLLKNA